VNRPPDGQHTTNGYWNSRKAETEGTMNKGRLVGGIVCLALAALLLVLSIRLPADKLMFMAGGINVPMIVLALVGLALLVTSWKRQSV
jgi:hypothetical protein